MPGLAPFGGMPGTRRRTGYLESPEHASLAWAAVHEFLESDEGRKAFVHALQSVDYEAALVASIEKLERRLLQEDRVPLE